MTFLEWLAQVNQTECDPVTAHAIYKVLKLHGNYGTNWAMERKLNRFTKGAKLNGAQRRAMIPLWESYKAVKPMLERLAPAKDFEFQIHGTLTGRNVAHRANMHAQQLNKTFQILKDAIA